MEFKSLIIKKFRNFEDINVNLTNQNVVFGMNDVGKTNFLSAIRFLLDREVRKNGFKETDYFQRNVSEKIEITLEVSLADYVDSEDTKFIVSKVGGARNTDNLESFYFKVEGEYDTAEEIGEPKIYWGNEKDNLLLVTSNGMFTDLDKIFQIVYVDPTINLDQVFKKNRKNIFDESKLNDDDKKISNEIKQLSNEVNNKIGTMEMIKEFQTTLTGEYHDLRKEKVTIELKSEMAIKGYFDDLIPYIKKENDDKLYPTSGDGRKKILAYSMLNHLVKKQKSHKLTIYLIEEPENSLHRSMQLALSYQLFNKDIYKYFFLSTHSAELLYEMDNAALIRLYSKDKTDCSSTIYELGETYKNLKKELNRTLAHALFTEKVLLVEGPSEKVLFEKILNSINPFYELEGGFLIEVAGIKFKPYVAILTSLGIKCFVKTDNDLKSQRGNAEKFDLIGFNRCLELTNRKKLHSILIDLSAAKLSSGGYSIKTKEKIINETKLRVYRYFKFIIEDLESKNIYLSKIDLENDLYEAIPEKMTDLFGPKDPIKEIQKAKLLNMIKLVEELSNEDCKSIYNHNLFCSLKEFAIYESGDN